MICKQWLCCQCIVATWFLLIYESEDMSLQRIVQSWVQTALLHSDHVSLMQLAWDHKDFEELLEHSQIWLSFQMKKTCKWFLWEMTQ